jgi:hypothetical protein
MWKVVLTALAFTLAGCGEDQQVKAAKEAVLDQLIDPQSAQFTNVRKLGSFAVCGEVNSKNRLGGYVGRRKFIAFVQNDSNVDATISDSDDNGPGGCELYEGLKKEAVTLQSK